MPEDYEPAASKRKASPSPEAEEKFKRIKVEGGDDDANGEDASNRRRSHSPTISKVPRDRSPDAERHPGGANTDADINADTIPPKREPESEALDRLASEARNPIGPAASRPQGLSQEEKKRGKRLFGGLLSTLSQTTSSSHQKKRLEIERRQLEKAQQQRVEYDKRRVEKLEKLRRARKIEQIKFDEQVMHTRHSNMLTLARSLRTKSEPKLYYRPWELTRAQERTIDEQVCNAKETIARECDEFKARKERKLRELGERPSSRSDNTVGSPKFVLDTNRRVSTSSNKMALDKEHDEHVEEMVHDEEDTVLY